MTPDTITLPARAARLGTPSTVDLDLAAHKAAAAIAQRMCSDASALSEAQRTWRDQGIRWLQHGKRPAPYSETFKHLWLCFEMRPSEWTSFAYHFADETLRIADDLADHIVLLIQPYWQRASRAALRESDASHRVMIATARCTQALKSAAAFAAAVEALPVGKDIRNRLKALLEQHLKDLEQLDLELTA